MQYIIKGETEYQRLLSIKGRKEIIKELESELKKINYLEDNKQIEKLKFVIRIYSIKDWEISRISKRSNLSKFLKENNFEIIIELGKIYSSEFDSFENADYCIKKFYEIAEKANRFKSDFEKILVTNLLIDINLIGIKHDNYLFLKEKTNLELTKKEKAELKNIRRLQAMKTKKSVCVAKAKILVAILEILDIECIKISGSIKNSEVKHAYNIVKIDGSWYLWDVTESALINHMIYQVYDNKGKASLEIKNKRIFKGVNGIYKPEEIISLTSTNKNFIDFIYEFCKKTILKE